VATLGGQFVDRMDELAQSGRLARGEVWYSALRGWAEQRSIYLHGKEVLFGFERTVGIEYPIQGGMANLDRRSRR
jgi:hypothetical protein